MIKDEIYKSFGTQTSIILLKDKIEEIYEDWQGNRVNEVKTFGDLFEVWYDEWVDTVRQTTVKSQLKVLNNIVFPAISKELAISQMTKTFMCNAWNKKILKIRAKKQGNYLQVLL